jgi:hypothetical protein
MAERFDSELAIRLREVSTTSVRQLMLLDWYYNRFISELSKTQIIRYEDIIATGGMALSVIHQDASGLRKLTQLRLQSHNSNRLYDRDIIMRSTELLLDNDRHGCWSLYDHDDVVRLNETLLS